MSQSQTEWVRIASLEPGDLLASQHGAHGHTYDLVIRVQIDTDVDDPNRDFATITVDEPETMHVDGPHGWVRVMMSRYDDRFPMVMVKKRTEGVREIPKAAQPTPVSETQLTSYLLGGQPSEPRVMDGYMGPMTSSMLLAERIMRLPEADQRAEIAALIRTVWSHQARASDIRFPDVSTRERWAQISRDGGL